MNPLLLTDSYKINHYKQYPPKTTNIYSYFESRGGMFPEVVFFGLQYYLKKYLSTPFTKEHIEEAAEFCRDHFGDTSLFNRSGFEYILNEFGGAFPIRIKAVKEGTPIPTSNVLMTVENTDPNCYWLTNYLETILSQVWYGSTVATLSREMKKLILSFLKETGEPDLIDFKLHDFGYRGVSSVESAGMGAAAHLINFKGTDTIAGILFTKQFYGSGMTGFSIPAAEHSTITAWGQHNEPEAYLNMIKQYGDCQLYAVVSDSYDIYRACSKYWGEDLKAKVLEAKGTLVIRPDSGIPHEVVVKCLDILGDKFGYSINQKGYKILNPKIRLIQGDGIDFEETRKILQNMRSAGWSADNVAFGMGGGLLQKVNRDTQKFAFKCSNAVINNRSVDVYKCPVTDNGKMSKKGRLSLIKSGASKEGPFITVNETQDDALELVYENGKILRDQHFDDVRRNASI